MSTPARGKTLYGLNAHGLLGAALERCPDGIVSQDVANEELRRYFAAHPEEQTLRREAREPGEERAGRREMNQAVHRLIREEAELERRIRRRRGR